MKILLLITMLFVIPVQAADIEISLGHAQWEKSGNGIWWQDPFPNQFNLQSTSYTIAISDYVTESSRWRVGYTNLGAVTSYAEAVADDANYNGHGCYDPCLPMSHWYGTGSVDGIFASLAPEYKIGNVILSAEAGLWFYTPKFVMDVPDWCPTHGCTPQSIQARHRPDMQIAMMFGIGMSYKSLLINVRSYRVDASGDEFPAIYQGYTHDISIGYRF